MHTLPPPIGSTPCLIAFSTSVMSSIGGNSHSASNDGTPDSYVAAPAETAISSWTNVMAVRVYVLARNIDNTPGYSDVKTYALGSGITFTPSGSETQYRRHAYSSLVRLNNPSGRRECSTGC